MTPNPNPREWFGNIDIYLFDQILKNRFDARQRILDAGCGGGRNLVYFMRAGYEVFAVDQSTDAIKYVRQLASTLAPSLAQENFRVETIEQMSFADASFDCVLSSAVLHFAEDEAHWNKMVREMWRVLKPGGMFFARLASLAGISEQAKHLEGRRYLLPDTSERFLVDDEMLMATTQSLGGEFLEPIKTVVVRNKRAMMTWCVRKL